MSAVFQNPAAIGVYRFSEISLTPAVEINRIDANINQNQRTGTQDRFVMGNLGFVLVNETKNPFWRSFNVGIAHTRINSFNDELNIGSEVPYLQSLVFDFVQEANGNPPNFLSDFGARLAYDTFVIDNGGGDGTEYSGFYIGGDILEQTQVSNRAGRITETSLTFGGNYEDKLFIGGSLNIQSLFLNSEVTTSERFVRSDFPPPAETALMTSYALRDRLETEGIGVNLRLGAIYRLNDYVRVGGSIQTPTTFALSDNFSTRMVSNWINNPEPRYTSEALGFFDYRVRTPWRYMVSAAGFLGTKGFISAQYEYANFSRGKLLETNRRGSNADFSFANDLIAREFAAVHTIRAGAELRANKNLFFRAGFAYFTYPIPGNEALVPDARLDRSQYSGGMGYRNAAWSLDLAYVLSRFDEPYRITNFGNIGLLENTLSLLAVTLNFRL